MQQEMFAKLMVAIVGVMVMISASARAHLDDDREIQEYGIVLIPEAKCLEQAKRINAEIVAKLPNFTHVHNQWHITLYHSAYLKKDIPEIKKKLANLHASPLTLEFSSFSEFANKWIFWNIHKNHELQKLHERVVDLASPYHQRILNRVQDTYNSLEKGKRQQADQYGVDGILEFYNPHMTVFYQDPPDHKIESALKNIQSIPEKTVCMASEIVIGELGYNGNILKVIESIYL
jgi:2'-5' RNA ligase